MAVLSIADALKAAIAEEMRRDPSVFCMGEDEDIPGGMGGAFTVTKGIGDEFGYFPPIPGHKQVDGVGRAINTPISEILIAGACVGSAMMGMRPVADLQYCDFLFCMMDQLVNQAAKMRYMSGGKVKVPMVMRCPSGATNRGAQHAQSPETYFAHVPGLKVVCPSTAYDAKGLMKTAIRDDNPVIFFEHKLLYAHKEEIPEGEYTIPLGEAKIKREGKDLTIISWSREVNFSLEAAETLAQEGIDVEVLDLRTLVPLDWEAIKASVSKTHRVVIVCEEVKRGSYAGEISAQIAEELLDELDAPVERVCGLNIVSPFSPVLEDQNFPHPADIVAAVKRVLNQ